MERKEYMRIPIACIPQFIVDYYFLQPLVHNGYILVEIRKGMYGLPQAGILTNNQLVAHLAEHGYIPAKNTPGLFNHTSNGVTFTLCVNDFGITYVSQDSTKHLEMTLRKKYKLTTDWAGTTYLGLTLDWDYDACTINISMPGYIARALSRFQHPDPMRPQHSPHAWSAPAYGAPTQLTDHPDASAPLSGTGKLFIQQVLGVLLYYARAVDNTLLVALGTFASTQASPTESTHKGVIQILNYCTTYPDAVVRFHASVMALYIHIATKARSRAGGYFFLSDRLADPTMAPSPDAPPPPFNGPIYMGHPQTTTPIQTDNACAASIVNSMVKQHRSKAINMHFYWVHDRVKIGDFLVYWQRGIDNDADYFTKYHSPSHYRKMHSRYLHEKPNESSPAFRSQ